MFLLLKQHTFFGGDSFVLEKILYIIMTNIYIRKEKERKEVGHRTLKKKPI